MHRAGLTVAALFLLIQITPPVSACSLCGGQTRKVPLAKEWGRHALVVYGYPANARLDAEAVAKPGAGATDFHIEKILKPHPLLGKQEVLQLMGYLPSDGKTRYLAFFDVIQNRLELNVIRSIKSPAMLEYLEGAQPYQAKSRVEALLYHARFLDHADEQIAEDAFLEFAGSTDQEVGEAAKRLAPERFRTLLQNPKLDAERISMFAFLLGSCGGPKDAEFLKSMLSRPSLETQKALDGILGGYVALEPREGWNWAARMLGDPKRTFHERFALVRMVRFYHSWKPKEFHKEILRCYQALIPDGEMADFAIEDLRQWKSWELTATVLAQHGKKSHQAPIVRRAIVRYALSCPLPEARPFVERARRQEPDLVRELEEDLAFESGK